MIWHQLKRLFWERSLILCWRSWYSGSMGMSGRILLNAVMLLWCSPPLLIIFWQLDSSLLWKSVAKILLAWIESFVELLGNNLGIYLYTTVCLFLSIDQSVISPSGFSPHYLCSCTWKQLPKHYNRCIRRIGKHNSKHKQSLLLYCKKLM